jgi:glycosyltransferase involved in cell wall biosynthesis
VPAVSVLVLTLNEELHLRDCLESVRWSDDVHVVDSGSTDRTQEIARATGAQVHVHPFENFSAQRNWALRHAPFRHEWVLVLDADERVPADLAAEMADAVARARPEVGGFEMRRRVYFQGCWLRHAGQFQAFWFLRLFRHPQTRYEDRQVNEYPIVEGERGRLHGALLHENRQPVEELLEKFRRYASMEAEETARLLRGGTATGLQARWNGTAEERRRWLKQLHLRLPFRGTRKLLYLLLWRGGLLDGPAGWSYCWLMAQQEYMISSYLRARRRGQALRKPGDAS